MIKLEVNNQQVLEMEYSNNWTVVTTKNKYGEIESAYGIEDADMVMLLNYYQHQKENGLQLF